MTCNFNFAGFFGNTSRVFSQILGAYLPYFNSLSTLKLFEFTSELTQLIGGTRKIGFASVMISG